MGCLYHSDDPFESGNDEEGLPSLCVIAPHTCVEILLRLLVRKFKVVCVCACEICCSTYV